MAPTSETSWTYEWRNSEHAPQRLNYGLLTAVSHAPDKSEYQRHYDGETVHNFGSASANFTLDIILVSPLEPGGGYIYPAGSSKTLRPRPSLSVGFNEPTTVTLRSFRVDGVSQ